MSWTKRELITDAFGELALAGYEFDLAPEELQAALRALDTMMATWAARGVQVGYALGLTPSGSSLDDDSGLPLIAVEAVYRALALRIAGSKGKAVPASSKASAKDAYDSLLSFLASGALQEQQFRSGTPRGSGSKPWRTTNQPFVPTPNTDPLQTDAAGGLTFNGTE